MPTLQQVRDYINPRLNTLWDILVARQAVFYSNRGYCAELIASHLDAAIPSNADDASDTITQVAPTRLADTKTDTAYSWSNVLTPTQLANLASLPMSIRCDSHAYTNGHGFTLVVFVRWNGKLYTNTKRAFIPFGSDSADDIQEFPVSGWQQVEAV